MDQNQKKQQAAHAAIKLLPPDGYIGVGTGSTVNFFIDALAEIKHRYKGAVSSSIASTERLKQHGIPVLELSETGDLDVYVDGADESTKHRQLIKGGGAALTREKIVAAASRKFICIIDESKLVGILGKFPLPIEVIPMARSYVARQLLKMGGRPVWRQGVKTDNGNEIIDIHDLNILNPVEMETRINQIAGVVTVGLFAQRPADVVLMATDNGVEQF